MIIDFHTHVYPDPIASKTIAYLNNVKGVLTYTDGTLTALHEMMARNKVDLSVVLPIATRKGQDPKLNDYAKSLCSNDIISFGSIYPEEEDWQSQIDYAAELGLKGLKFHPDFQEFYYTSEKIIKIIRYALDCDFIVTLHVGIDPAIRELVYSTPKMVRKMIDQLPNTHKLVLAHLGGFLYWDDVLEYICGLDCYIDTALAVGAILPQKMLDIFEKHGYDRVLYGSDLPLMSQTVSLESISQLLIPQEKLDMILYKNAVKLLGLEVES